MLLFPFHKHPHLHCNNWHQLYVLPHKFWETVTRQWLVVYNHHPLVIKSPCKLGSPQFRSSHAWDYGPSTTTRCKHSQHWMEKIHIWALSTLTTEQTHGDILMFRHTVHCYSWLFCSQAVGALPVSCKIWFDCWIHKQSPVLLIQLSYCEKADTEVAVYCTNQMQTKEFERNPH